MSTRTQKRHALRQQGTLNPHPQTVQAPLFGGHEFFDSDDLIQVKYEMLRQAQMEGQAVSEAARSFGFSRPSFYQAQAAFKESGLSGLLPQKRGPRSGHKLTPAVMAFVAELRKEQPSSSWEDVARKIAKEFQVSVHPRSIARQQSRQKKLR